MAESRSPRACAACGQLAEKRISAARLSVDYEGYTCPITDKWIEGKRAHRENLKQHNCRVYEPGETQDAMKRQEYNWRAVDKKVDDVVDQVASQLRS
jgi:hypothetical protein